MTESNSEAPSPVERDDEHSVPPDLLELLVCPLGKADLRLEDGALVCTRCGPVFKIEDGIPIMLIEEAKLPDGVDKVEDLECQKDGGDQASSS